LRALNSPDRRPGASEIPPSWLQIYRGYEPSELEIFNRFKPAHRPTEPGFIVDFLNVRTRVSSLWEGVRELDGQRLGVPIPADYHAETIEWLGLLRSAVEARNEYVAMEWGAGFGPWLVAGAAAARLLGIEKLRLCGVEADADHFASMQQHFADNDLDPAAHTLLHAGVGPSPGFADWPVVPDPANDWGLRPVRATADTDYLNGRTYKSAKVPMFGATELIERELRWDLVHIDVQGWEGDVCAAAIDAMDKRVHRLIIGTHSRKLDGDLMALFYSHGWIPENEKPSRISCHGRARTLEGLTVADGTQVWRNPRLDYAA